MEKEMTFKEICSYIKEHSVVAGKMYPDLTTHYKITIKEPYKFFFGKLATIEAVYDEFGIPTLNFYFATISNNGGYKTIHSDKGRNWIRYANDFIKLFEN